MISANLSYRYGDTIETIFRPIACDVEFFVEDEDTLKILEDTKRFIVSTRAKLSFEEAKCTQVLIDRNAEIIGSLQRDFADLKKKYPVLLFHKNAYQQAKSIRGQIDGLIAENGLLEFEMEELEKNKTYFPEELITKYREMLKFLGFSNMGVTSTLKGHETESFQAPLTEEELKDKAYEYYGVLSSKLMTDINRLKEAYGIAKEQEGRVQ